MKKTETKKYLTGTNPRGYHNQTHIQCCANWDFGVYLGYANEPERMCICEIMGECTDITTTDICGESTEVYVSKYDGSYLTHVGMEDELQFLVDRGITEQLTSGVGFSPKENKWYGWSHRAIYWFTIGSTCRKGDCHYREDRGEWVAETMADAKQMALDFHHGVL